MVRKYTRIQQSLSLFILLFLFQTAVSDTDSISFTKDTYINSAFGSLKYGNSDYFYLGVGATSLLEMSLTSVASKCPSSAVLRLYTLTSASDVTGKFVKINHIQANWGETTVTYNNFVKVVYSTAQYQIQSKGSNWYELSVNNAMLSKAIATESSQVFIFQKKKKQALI